MTGKGQHRLTLRVLAAGVAVAVAGAGLAQVRIITTSPQLEDPLAGPQIVDPLTGKPGMTTMSVLQASDDPKFGDDQYRPYSGQAGKDVVWVPTPDSLVVAMLESAGVTRDDYVVDLGSGDGRIAIAAARQFGARAHGIEYNPKMVSLARREAQRVGVANRVTFAQADIFKSDFSDATVVTMYLLPSLNLRLRDTILNMRPGTRVVSHAFDMGDWEPDRTIRTDDASGYLWIVPANIAGRWAFEIGNDRFAADLVQQYQKLSMPRATPFRDGRIRGTTVSLTRSNGQVLEGEVRGDTIVGRGWTATRIAQN
ncbi:MAG: class I SAM-dependent methyltransferase [Thermaurantiacus sp.]